MCAAVTQLQLLQGLAKRWEKPDGFEEPCGKQSCSGPAEAVSLKDAGVPHGGSAGAVVTSA